MTPTEEISNLLVKQVAETKDKIITQEMAFYGFTIQDAIDYGSIQHNPYAKTETIFIKGCCIVTFYFPDSSNSHGNIISADVSYKTYRGSK